MIKGSITTYETIGRYPLVWKRSLISLPKTQQTFNKNKRQIPTITPKQVPCFNGEYQIYQPRVIRPDQPPNPVNKGQVLDKVFKQLNLQRETATPTAMKIPIYKQRSFNRKVQPPLPLKPFKFNPYNYTPTELEISKAPSLAPESKYFPNVTKSSPLVTKPSELRGLNAFMLYFVNNHQDPVYKCEYFILNYWPTMHYISKLRKSKPSLSFVTGKWNKLNDPKLKEKKGATQSSVNLFPMRLAYNRRAYRILFKKEFLKGYLKDEQLVKERDGAFRAVLNVYPVTDAEVQQFKTHIQEALKSVMKLNIQKEIQNAIKFDKRVPWKKVWDYCDRHNIPRIQPNNQKG